MDLSADGNRAYTAAEWQSLWNWHPDCRAFGRPAADSRPVSPSERVLEAARSAESLLAPDGFTLLANGGLPLLKRNRESWIDEVLFHAPNTGVAGHYAPVSVELIVSYRDLEAVRIKYSRSCIMVSPYVAGINLGAFEFPPSHILWNAEYAAARTEIARRLLEEAVPWIDDLADPITLEQRVIERTLPWVDDVTGLELVLAMGGRLSARRVIRHWLDMPEMRSRLSAAKAILDRHLGPVYRSDDPDLNLGSLCLCYDLWPSANVRR